MAPTYQDAKTNAKPSKSGRHARQRSASHSNVIALRDIRAVASSDQPRYPIFLPSASSAQSQSTGKEERIAKHGRTRSNSYQNTMLDPRLSQVLPGLTCSDCGEQIRLDQLGKHVCVNAPPMPSLPLADKTVQGDLGQNEPLTRGGLAGIGAVGRRSTETSQVAQAQDRVAGRTFTPSPQRRRQLPHRPRSPNKHTKSSSSTHSHSSATPSSSGSLSTSTSISSTFSIRSPENKLPFFEKYSQMMHRNGPGISPSKQYFPMSNDTPSDRSCDLSSKTMRTPGYSPSKCSSHYQTPARMQNDGDSSFFADEYTGQLHYKDTPSSHSRGQDDTWSEAVIAPPHAGLAEQAKVQCSPQSAREPTRSTRQRDPIQVASSATLDGLLADLELEVQAPRTKSIQDHTDGCLAPKQRPQQSNRPTQNLQSEPLGAKLFTGFSHPAARTKGCQRCLLPVSGHPVQVPQLLADHLWHPHCFTCTSCGDSFPEGVFYAFGSLPYCSYHYAVESGTLCTQCRQPIEGSCLEVLQDTSDVGEAQSLRRFHPACLRCQGTHCGRHLNGTFYQSGSSRFCEASQCMRECTALMRVDRQAIQQEGGTASRSESKRLPIVEKRQTRLVNVRVE